MRRGSVKLPNVDSKGFNAVYAPPSWLAKIEFINQIILGTNVLLSILAEQSGGKTTFIKILQANLDPKIKSHCFSASALFSPHSFMQQFGSLLNVQGDNTFANFIDHCNKNELMMVLIIDDAQYLPDLFIDELLSALKNQGLHGYFHVCLFSNFSLVPTLNALETRSYKDMIHSIEIGPLTEDETSLFVQHQILTKGSLISDVRLKQFFQLTQGSLMGINSQMDGFFSFKNSLKKFSRQKKRFFPIFIAAGSVSIAFVVAFILWPFNSPLLNAPKVAPVAHNIGSSLPLKIEKSVLLSSIAPYNLAASRQFMQPIQLHRLNVARLKDEQAKFDESMVVMDKVLVIPKIVQAPKIKIKKIKSVSSYENKNRSKNKADKTLSANKNKEHFTIQLLAGHKPQELARFARRHGVKAASKVLHFKQQGAHWYVLVYGDYTNKMEAKAAVDRLPKVLVENKPWVRPLSDLQRTA